MNTSELTLVLLILEYPGGITIHARMMMLSVLDYEPQVAIVGVAAEHDGFQIH